MSASKTTIHATVLADSIAPHGRRITSFNIVMPKIFVAEFNTHRKISRNSASSRAVPTTKLIDRVLTDPYIPLEWGSNQKGMAAGEVIDPQYQAFAQEAWLHARDAAVEQARTLLRLNVHKQHTNRLLEPFLWTSIVATATEWNNFLLQRLDPGAQPEMQMVARSIKTGLDESKPIHRGNHDDERQNWHLPYVLEEERQRFDLGALQCISAARNARVSYYREGIITSLEEDSERHAGLVKMKHWSPLEHLARPLPSGHATSGNFDGWLQYRKTFSGEEGISPRVVA